MDSEALSPKTVTPSAPTEERTNICANCGTPLSDQYCPHCGQHSGQQRLRLRKFLFTSMQEVFKVNSGFLYTFCQLVYHPWTVIRNYIHGHRVRYTTPMNMLIILVLYVAIINSLFGTDIGNKLSVAVEYSAGDERTAVSDYIMRLANSLLSNQIFTNILLCIPMAAATYLTYIKFGSRRYNSAEFLVAAIYMVCTSIVYDIITLPFKLISDDFYSYVNTFAIIPVVVISLLRAFKVSNPITRVALILLNIVIAILLFLAFVLSLLSLIGPTPAFTLA
jgi:hypothetical protein